MRIALAQTRPVQGDLAANVACHLALAERAADADASLVVFGELSLTGYWPELAADLAVDPGDARLDELEQLSDGRGIEVAAGVPTPAGTRPRISLVVFRPGRPRYVYSKQYLHADEDPFFAPGERATGILGTGPKVGLAICYELSVPAHAEATLAAGADVYVASVAKTRRGVRQSSERLATIARQGGVPVLMANCVGPSGDGDCAGATSAWASDGTLLARLDDTGEGLVVFDTDTGVAVTL